MRIHRNIVRPPAIRPTSLATFPVVVFVGIVIPWAAGTTVQATILDACDPKFGCSGGVTFAITLSVVGGTLATMAAFLSQAIFRAVVLQCLPFFLAVAGLASGLSLALTLATIWSWPSLIYGPLEIPAMLLEWFVVSVVVCAVWLIAAGYASNLATRSKRRLPANGQTPLS